MILRAELPLDREAEGRFSVFDAAGACVFGPLRCLGEADDAEEQRHGTPDDDPVHVYGDHPFGDYRVTAIEPGKRPARSYGPFFFRLMPVAGQALEAWDAGRRGLGIHGGDLGEGATLRSTFGCLRIDNDTCEALAAFLAPDFAAGRPVLYQCRPLVP